MKHMPKEDGPQSIHESGAALISVVLILGLLSILLITGTLYVNSRSTIVVMTREDLHKRVLMESALAYGVGRVLSWPPGLPIRGNDRIRLNIGHATISWTEESGRLDINLAAPDRLTALLEGVGLNKESALVLANQIVMRRSPSTAPASPSAVKPFSRMRLGPFDHVIELLTIPGMTTDLYARIEPLITVYGLANKIDPRLAQTSLISSLISLTSADLVRLESARYATDEELNALIASIPNSSSLFEIQRTKAIRINIALQTTRGTKQQAEIIFVSFDDDNYPYRILEWREI